MCIYGMSISPFKWPFRGVHQFQTPPNGFSGLASGHLVPQWHVQVTDLGRTWQKPQGHGWFCLHIFCGSRLGNPVNLIEHQNAGVKVMCKPLDKATKGVTATGDIHSNWLSCWLNRKVGLVLATLARMHTSHSQDKKHSRDVNFLGQFPMISWSWAVCNPFIAN